MTSTRTRAAIIMMLIAALFLVACGGGDDTEGDTTATETEDTGADTGSEDTGTESEGGTIAVTAVEYEFEGLPETLPAGPTTMTFENGGKEPHEFIFVKAKDDTPMEELLSMPQKEAQKHVEFTGVTFAKPGETAKQPVEAELSAGTYYALCFVSTKESKKPHALLGMATEITVE